MKGIVGVAYAVLLRVVSVIKRMLCFLHITRRRKNSGGRASILPLHADVNVLSSVGEIQTSLPSNDVGFLTERCSFVYYAVIYGVG